MTGFGASGRDDEIVNDSLVHGAITVGTAQIEAKVGGSRHPDRQMLRIYNASNSTIYFGATGVTTANGEPLVKGQWVNIPAGDQLGIFLIAGSAGNSVIVSEWA